MKIKLLLMFVVATGFSSCKKDCEKNLTGTIKATNNSSDNYSITIGGDSKGIVPPKSSVVYEVGAGIHTIQATQQDGYVSIPEVKSQLTSVINCKESGFSFP
jgi:hypothetical protein